jgi:hypothetical protein
MKLASLRGAADGTLLASIECARTLALPLRDHPATGAGELGARGAGAKHFTGGSTKTRGFRLRSRQLAPPAAYQWLDGSAYLTHVERVRPCPMR